MMEPNRGVFEEIAESRYFGLQKDAKGHYILLATQVAWDMFKYGWQERDNIQFCEEKE